MGYKRKKVRAQYYLYVERACAYDGAAIAQAMGSAFGEIFGSIEHHGIVAKSAPMSLYTGMDPEMLRFRGGVIVLARDAQKATGAIKADKIPAGDAGMALHVGPYATLNQTHQTLWDQMARDGIADSFPIWELYVDDPSITPEADLRTEVYRHIG